ncbi:16S rRNA (cytosine(967)-C(5))-methyltransferase RsmB [Silvanigrella aquatica]|uniref:16S rRNA (cytosine(967)-C(5))-methyltransferase n=1 Tax=Silvanigrella aquatica TaxID=1915309 RepID=A0A1L4D2Q6_9BACT|nr:16S rRNA (cytosine(967)-C(5))-methyltransferase RsmB [Silvanigrella aquatica]APJ04471.1 16S rRNA (cytosine(967)-C(5))-methyltransferase [Silvanigrella aquatica]
MSTRSGSLTRAIAIDALTHVLTRNIHSDVALEKLFANYPNLRPLDKAFIYEMVFGSLRWLAKMDWIMSHMLDRSFSSLDPRVANALRIGTYQIYYMDRVPERAAVSETVEAVKQVGVPNAASLVNAILRRVAKKSEYFPKPDKVTQAVDYYSMHHSFPQWMVERWYKQLSLERFEYLLSNNNRIPKNSLKLITRNPLPEGESDLATYLLKTQSIESSWRPMPGALRIETLPKFKECEAFQKGCYIVQDEAAQLATSLVQASPTDSCLDACAAPGGKSIYLWESGVEPQNLTVCDFAQKRLKILRENFSRMRLEGVQILHGDVVEQCQGKIFQKILLDAPCSAMGVIRRHPEIKWLRTLNDIQNCALEQTRLLDGLAKNVAIGGELIYIVCSFELEETINQISSFLEKHQNFEKINPQDRIHDFYKKYVTRDNELLIYSGNPDDIDGFFGVILKRNA